MNPSDIKKRIEILKIAKQKIEYGHVTHICNAIKHAHEHSPYTYLDCKKVLEWFINQKPTYYRHVEFYTHFTYRKESSPMESWWEICASAITQRLLLLSKLIEEEEGSLQILIENEKPTEPSSRMLVVFVQ